MSLVASCQLHPRPPSSSSTEHYVGPTVLCKVHDRQDNRRLPEIFLLLEVICLALRLNFQCTSTAPSRVVVNQIMMWLALWASFDSTHPLLDKCTPSLWKFFFHVWNSHNSVWEIKTSGLICRTVISSVCLVGVPCCWSHYQIVFRGNICNSRIWAAELLYVMSRSFARPFPTMGASLPLRLVVPTQRMITALLVCYWLQCSIQHKPWHHESSYPA